MTTPTTAVAERPSDPPEVVSETDPDTTFRRLGVIAAVDLSGEQPDLSDLDATYRDQALIVTLVAAATFGLTRYRAGVEVSIVVLVAVAASWVYSALTGVEDDEAVSGPIGPGTDPQQPAQQQPAQQQPARQQPARQ